MRPIFVILIICFLSCKTPRKIDSVESPSQNKISKDGTIEKRSGEENAKRMKYYNTLQHKSFYKHSNFKKKN